MGKRVKIILYQDQKTGKWYRNCTSCGAIKENTEANFHRDSSRALGFGSWCKECKKAQQQETVIKGTGRGNYGPRAKEETFGKRRRKAGQTACSICGHTLSANNPYSTCWCHDVEDPTENRPWHPDDTRQVLSADERALRVSDMTFMTVS